MSATFCEGGPCREGTSSRASRVDAVFWKENHDAEVKRPSYMPGLQHTLPTQQRYCL